MGTTSPFRTNPSLGPNLHQVVTATPWYEPKSGVVSPQLGDWSVGDNGHQFIWVKASSAIAAAASPGTQVSITEPALTAASGSGGFYAPIAGVASGSYFWAQKGTAL